MDSLAAVFRHFSLKAGVFYAGMLCGTHAFGDDAPHGHIHLIRRGPVRLIGRRKKAIDITEPSLLFMPRAIAHQLIADNHAGADVVCGSILIGGSHNPIADSLPDLICTAIADLHGVEALLNLIFDEAFSQEQGRQAALDRLCEVLIIRLLRYCLANGLSRGGTLAGLADQRLSKVLMAVHHDPSRTWNLPDLAALAGMSRARFAARFRTVVGETPADYIVYWRILMAQQLLKKGLPIKQVSLDVGYGSPSAFSRAFTRRLGYSPMSWIRRDEDPVTQHDGNVGFAP